MNTGDQASLGSESSRENVDDSDMDTASGDCVLCSDTDGVHMNFPQEVLEEGMGFL